MNSVLSNQCHARLVRLTNGINDIYKTEKLNHYNSSKIITIIGAAKRGYHPYVTQWRFLSTNTAAVGKKEIPLRSHPAKKCHTKVIKAISRYFCHLFVWS